jgi:hypothetical protein
MRRPSKKILAVLLGLVMVVAGAGAAYAYWTAGGGGTGTAGTGTSQDLVVNQTSTVTDMGPGDTAQALSGDFDNPGDGPIYVGSVTAAIGAITGADGDCTAADYTLATPVMTVDAQVPAGDAQGEWTGATIKFNNSATVNQDGCKNAAVAIDYTIQAQVPA